MLEDEANPGEEEIVDSTETDTEVEEEADVDTEETEDVEDSTEEVSEETTDKPSRSKNRVSALADEAKRERELRIAAEARAETLERTRSGSSSNDDAQRRAEKIALMDPEERASFERDEAIKALRIGQETTRIQIADYADKAQFERKAVTNPIYARHAEWVERTLESERRAGRNPAREVLLKFKIGEDALNAKPTKKLVAKKQEAATRVSTSKSIPTSARSDVSNKKGADDSLDALRNRILAREIRGDM